MSWKFLSIFFLCVFLVVVIMLIISLHLALINIYPHWYASFCDDDNSKCSRHSTIYSIIFLLLDISFSYPLFFFAIIFNAGMRIFFPYFGFISPILDSWNWNFWQERCDYFYNLFNILLNYFPKAVLIYIPTNLYLLVPSTWEQFSFLISCIF